MAGSWNQTAILCLGLIALWSAAPTAQGEERTGEQIYQAMCATCHGPKGEGTKDLYPNPLIGDRSVLELTYLIERTMPEGEPEKCVGEDAKKVATYIHDTFYSPLAQARNEPARIELSRLTVRQYQNAVTDLIGSFRRRDDVEGEPGLKGEYYKNRRFRSDDRVLERVDSQVNFDFGTASPVPEKTEDYEFSIRWEGSVLAPDSGEYEFVVRTEHAARLYINDGEQPLIDAWVKSGDDTEYRGTIQLLGGRFYPLRLEFSKAKQGVDDSDKQKTKPESKPASIRLCWKQPHRAEEPVPARCLRVGEPAELFVLMTPFPPDDRSVGYERGTTISKAWESATTDGALEVAAYVADNINELAGIREPRRRGLRSPSDDRRRDSDDGDNAEDSTEERVAKMREFCLRFAERAFRRPLSDEQKQLYVERQFADAATPEMALKRAVLLTLKSPRFLYRETSGSEVDAYDVAARLSFALWDSLPDEKLLEAAAKGQLGTREQVAAQAERMLADERARSKVREFLIQWLRIDRMIDLAKDPKQYGEFDEQIASDLRTSLELMLDEIVWSEKSDFRELLLADSIHLNGRLAKFYGADLPEDAEFQKVGLNPEQRAGVLTHPFLMSGFAYTAASSPIHRGVFVARSVLGRSLRPPPEAVSPLAPDLHPDLTTRERVILQTEAESCAVCHTMINPLGFTLEHFDAVGRYRAEEKGRPIEADGNYLTQGGAEVRFTGAREMAQFLAGSPETHSAFVKQLFHHLIKQPINAFGLQQNDKLRESFSAGGFNIRKLLGEIVVTATMHRKESPTADP